MKDLTAIFLTVNKVPKKWAKYHRKVVSKALGDTPVISITREPSDWGTNIIQKEPVKTSNVYRQMLRGAKLATTPYIAVIEDDTLYPEEHFTYRSPLDTFAYNMNRAGLFTWGNPTYFWKLRVNNSTLIAPREQLIKALEEKFNKYPDGVPNGLAGELGRKDIEGKLGVSAQKTIEFKTTIAIVSFGHDFSMEPLQQNHRKRMGFIRAFDIPYWGKASEVVKHFV